MKKYLGAVLAPLLLAALLPGCSGGLPAQLSQSGGKANFQLLVSDAPNDIGDFYSVNVTVSKIGVLSADTNNWTTYSVNETFDLTKLKGDNATALWDGMITSGNYTKVFIYVDNVTGILSDNSSGTPLPGENVTLKLPSNKLQISKPFSVNATADGSIVNFVFDITVIKAGDSGQYILKPQIDQSGPSRPFRDVTPRGQRQQAHPQGQGRGKPETPEGTVRHPDGNLPNNRHIPGDSPNRNSP